MKKKGEAAQHPFGIHSTQSSRSPWFWRFSINFVYALFSWFFLLKSSNCAKFLRLAMSLSKAGGYCPTQYQLPGASHFRFAGSATQSLDSWDTLRILKIRIMPY